MIAGQPFFAGHVVPVFLPVALVAEEVAVDDEHVGLAGVGGREADVDAARGRVAVLGRAVGR